VVVFGSQHHRCCWSAVADSWPREEWIANRKFLKKKKKFNVITMTFGTDPPDADPDLRICTSD
jgi:hypothetical protein